MDTHRALVSAGATGAVAPELFEDHKTKKNNFREISKKFISKKKFYHPNFQNPTAGPGYTSC